VSECVGEEGEEEGNEDVVVVVVVVVVVAFIVFDECGKRIIFEVRRVCLLEEP
jgi:hypothetical protein